MKDTEIAEYYNHLVLELTEEELNGEHRLLLHKSREAVDAGDNDAVEFWAPRHGICDGVIDKRFGHGKRSS